MVSKFSDVAVGLSEDKLGFRDYAEGVIATMESISKEDTPFTIGIFGSWGSGKTSFMQIMQELLAGYLFNWANVPGNDNERLLRFLMDDLNIGWAENAEISKLGNGKTIHISKDKNSAEIKINEKKKKATLKIKSGGTHNLKVKNENGNLNIYKSTGYEIIFFKSWEYGNEEKPWIPFMIKVVDELFDKGVVKKELIRNIFLFSTDVVLQKYSKGTVSTGVILNLIERSRINSVFKNWLDKGTKEVIERVTKIEKFKEAIEKRAEESPNGKIIIFIDDLDRIPEEKIVDFLDSLKIFLDIKGCIFVLGCDYEILKHALRKKHGEEEIYKDYFDKIVQTEFYIPKIREHAIKNYLHFLTRYLFSWANVPGNDSEILLRFLRDDLDIGWAENAEVSKSYDGKTIHISKDKNSAEIKIDEKREKAIMKNSDGRPHDLKVKKEDGKLNIYSTDWSEDDIKECTQLVNHSIGGNPRKIKRVVNATMLIKSVFEKRLATFLEEFERPKIRTKRRKEGKEEEIEEPMVSRIKISSIFTPTEVFELLFEKKMLFKLMCMREQWPANYEDILSDEEKQKDSISLQDGDITEDIIDRYKKALYSTAKKQDELEKDIKKLSKFLKDPPRFQGVDRFQKVMSLKTYLTLLEISSPEGGIPMEYPEPEKLPINLFNRYMLFERINKGKVDRRFIKEKINQMDWKSSPGSYFFFIQVICALEYEDILWKYKGIARKLLNRTKDTYTEKIQATLDLRAIGGILYLLREIDEKTAGELVCETKDMYAKKIRGSKDPGAIGTLLGSVSGINEKTAGELVRETKDTYAEKIIRDSTDPGAIGTLLGSVSMIDGETGRELLYQTKDTIADKIRTSTDLYAITRLLGSVSWINEKTAGELVRETKDTYAEKIRGSTDLWAIGGLLYSVREIDGETGRELLNETKDTIAEEIRTSTDPEAIGTLLEGVRRTDGETSRELQETARKLLNETKDTIAEEIRTSTDLYAIRWLFYIVRGIDEKTARELLDQTKDTIAEKIRASTDLYAIRGLLYIVRGIDEKTARVLLHETKDTYAEKIRTSTDADAIDVLLDNVIRIDKETAGELLNETKDAIADKIRTSTDAGAIEVLLYNVIRIDKETAGELLNETKDTIAEEIRTSIDLRAIGGLLDRVGEIDGETGRELLKETKDTIAEEIRTSTDPGAIGGLLDGVREIEEKTARVLLHETKDTIAEKIRASTDPGAIGGLLYRVIEIDEKTARVLLHETKDTYAEKIRASTDLWAINDLLHSVREVDEGTGRELLNETKDTIAEEIRTSTDPVAIGWLLDSVRKIEDETARELLNQTKDTYAEKIRTGTDPGAIGWLLDRVRGIDEETAEWLEKEIKFKSKDL